MLSPKEATGDAAKASLPASSLLLNSLRQRERDLDTLDMEIQRRHLHHHLMLNSTRLVNSSPV